MSSGDAVGFPVGTPQLANLVLDLNPMTDLTPLVDLPALRRLSCDGAQTGRALTQVPTLATGAQGRLELLSLDYVGERGLRGEYFSVNIPFLQLFFGMSHPSFLIFDGTFVGVPIIQTDRKSTRLNSSH